MYETILLPVDLDDKHSWRKALPTAIGLCETYESKLVVMTVLAESDMPLVDQLLSPDYKNRLQQKLGQQLKAFVRAQITPDIEAQPTVAAGRVYQEIIRQAETLAVDLIIMGAINADRTRYALGPNTAQVIRHAPCSVMVVRD
jgi:nucleotide-binding universal stress UspA family protein